MTQFSKIAALALAASLATAPLATAQKKATPTGALQAMAHGAFHSLHAPTSGTARLVTANGRTVLRLQNLKTEVGPGLQVWLYEGAAPDKGAKDADIARGRYLKVGEFKDRFSGDFEFAVPAGADLARYKSVVLWCDLVDTAFGAASL
jgi:hypothetical protein